MNGDVTAMDINCALASRYRRDGDGYWSEISVTEPNDTVLRLDGVALEVNWRGDTWISGFEVKVSRGDFLRDAKYLRYKDYVDDLTLVCPARMIDRSEVPEPVGLMYYDPSKRTLRYRRKPNPSHGDTRQVEHRLLKKARRQRTAGPVRALRDRRRVCRTARGDERHRPCARDEDGVAAPTARTVAGTHRGTTYTGTVQGVRTGVRHPQPPRLPDQPVDPHRGS